MHCDLEVFSFLFRAAQQAAASAASAAAAGATTQQQQQQGESGGGAGALAAVTVQNCVPVLIASDFLQARSSPSLQLSSRHPSLSPRIRSPRPPPRLSVLPTHRCTQWSPAASPSPPKTSLSSLGAGRTLRRFRCVAFDPPLESNTERR